MTWPQPGEHYGDIQPEAAYEPPMYDSRLTGPGKWVWLTMNGQRVGCLATDGGAHIAWLDLDAKVSPYAPTATALITAGLRAAAREGVDPQVVWDSYASRVSMALSAETIETGSLDDLLSSLYGGG